MQVIFSTGKIREIETFSYMLSFLFIFYLTYYCYNIIFFPSCFMLEVLLYLCMALYDWFQTWIINKDYVNAVLNAKENKQL